MTCASRLKIRYVPDMFRNDGYKLSWCELATHLASWVDDLRNRYNKRLLFITTSFQDNKDINGHLAWSIIRKFYVTELLPSLVNKRRYQKHPIHHPILIMMPDMGRGKLYPDHLHGFMLLSEKGYQYCLSNENQNQLNYAFEQNHRYAMSFHMEPITENKNNIHNASDYMFKKADLIPNEYYEYGVPLIWS